MQQPNHIITQTALTNVTCHQPAEHYDLIAVKLKIPVFTGKIRQRHNFKEMP